MSRVAGLVSDQAPASEPPPAARSRSGAEPRPHSSGAVILRWMQVTLGTNTAIMAMYLGTGIVSARVMGPELKGLYNAVVIWPGVFTTLGAVGLPGALVTVYAKTPAAERRAVVWAALALSMAWGTAATIVCLLLAPRFLAHLGGNVGIWADVSALMILPSLATGVCSALLSVEQAFGRLNWINIIRAALYASTIAALALLGRLSPYAQVVVLWTVNLLASAPILLAAGRIMRGLRTASLRLATLLPVARQMSRIGFGFYAIGLAGMFNSQLDQMLASIWLSARDIGLYAVAISSLSVVGVITGAFGQVFFPMVAADESSLVIRRVNLSIRRGALLLGGATLLFLLVARPVLLLAYGHRYAGVWPALEALVLVALFSGLIQILYQGCFALRIFDIPAVGEIVGAGSGALLLFLLIPRWGIVGAGAAGSVSYGLDCLTVLWMWKRRTRSSWSDMRSRASDVTALADLLTAQWRRVFDRGRHDPAL